MEQACDKVSVCLQLRVKDLDFANKQLTVRDAKGRERRVTMLPISLIEELQFHLQIVKHQHQQDLEKRLVAN